MKFGLYVHIPYCLQKCTYCDFATTSWIDQSVAQEYMDLLRREIQWALPFFPTRNLSTIYFGGGTPSLVSAESLTRFLEDLEKAGISLQSLNEVTIEINPGTLDRPSLKALLGAGVSRFSVGSQTFKEHLLAPLGREHSVQDTLATLELLASENLNFTTDLLYGLPNQTLKDLSEDLRVLKDFSPPHVSTYNLTLPPKHFLQQGRADDDTQVEMYFLIVEELGKMGLEPYEISNLAKPGYRSAHNRIYWQDQAYWGAGMSAHSYLPARGPWGTRFSNPYSVAAYRKWVEALEGKSFEQAYEDNHREDLTQEQSVMDYVHTFLRQVEGFSVDSFQRKFGAGAWLPLQPRFEQLHKEGLLEYQSHQLHLTPRGRMLLNTVLSAVFT